MPIRSRSIVRPPDFSREGSATSANALLQDCWLRHILFHFRCSCPRPTMILLPDGEHPSRLDLRRIAHRDPCLSDVKSAGWVRHTVFYIPHNCMAICVRRHPVAVPSSGVPCMAICVRRHPVAVPPSGVPCRAICVRRHPVLFLASGKKQERARTVGKGCVSCSCRWWR